jgi:two-component system, NarL family, invasion response regulator UvrY
MTHVGINSLSQVEIDVIEQMRKGRSANEITNALHISANSLSLYQYKIIKKLRLKNEEALFTYVTNIQLQLDEGCAA